MQDREQEQVENTSKNKEARETQTGREPNPGKQTEVADHSDVEK